jgi:hypothetical protein
MMSARQKIKLPPGMFRNGTEYESAGRWYDGNLVRWQNGRLKPIGGFQAYVGAGANLVGVARGGIAFTDNGGFPYIIIGTSSKLYIGEGGVFEDVTPTGFVPGRVDSILGSGFSAGFFGQETFGTSRTLNTLQLKAATWSFDTFGNTVVMVMDSDRHIYQFDPTTGLVTIPAGSPTCVAVMSTNEDFLLALGSAGDARQVMWPDLGTSTDWTPTDINAAGAIDLNTAGRLVAGSRVGLQNLLWTDVDAHLLNFVGGQGIYAPIRIGTSCGLIGPRAFAVAASGAGAGETAYWISQGGFFAYAGTVVPLPCEVQDYIWANINWVQAAKIYASPNTLFNEIIWFFPSVNSNECDSYVIYNYKENIWYFGLQSPFLGARTTYIDRGVFGYPFGVNPAGMIFEHEVGYLANGATRVGQVYAQSGPAEIGNGDQVIYANMLVVDGTNLLNASNPVLTLTPQARLNPQAPLMASTPIPLAWNAEGYTPARFAGRQVALRVDQVADATLPWELGTMRVAMTVGSKR